MTSGGWSAPTSRPPREKVAIADGEVESDVVAFSTVAPATGLLLQDSLKVDELLSDISWKTSLSVTCRIITKCYFYDTVLHIKNNLTDVSVRKARLTYITYSTANRS